jgi:hypothetical protein
MLPEQYPDHITVLSDPKDTMVTGKTNKPTQKRRYNSMLTSQSHTLTTLKVASQVQLFTQSRLARRRKGPSQGKCFLVCLMVPIASR